MSDSVDLNVAYKESVALALTRMIANSEKIHDRKSVLDLYSECLEATRGGREVEEK